MSKFAFINTLNEAYEKIASAKVLGSQGNGEQMWKTKYTPPEELNPDGSPKEPESNWKNEANSGAGWKHDRNKTFLDGTVTQRQYIDGEYRKNFEVWTELDDKGEVVKSNYYSNPEYVQEYHDLIDQRDAGVVELTADERKFIENYEGSDEKSWADKANVKANVSIVEASSSSEGSLLHGDIYQSDHLDLDVDVAGYEAGANASVKGDIMEGEFVAEVGVNAEVYAVKVSGELAPIEIGPGELSAKAEAAILAEVDASAQIRLDPRNGDLGAGVNVEAFAGGKAEAEIKYGNDYGAATGSAEVSWGIGGEFDADMGISDGVITTELDLSATLGLGGGFSVEFEVDAGEIYSSAKDPVVNLAGDIGGGAVDLAGDIGGGAVDLAGDIGGGAVDLAGDIGGGVTSVFGWRP